jgi:formate dehydrogenase major subunit
MPVEDPDLRERFCEAWGSGSLPKMPGLSALEMMDAAASGRIKAMYIIGEDPVNSDPNSKKTEDALRKLDFLVVQEIFLTDTARMADLVLPAAVWAEKEGTFTSTERRVQWTGRAQSPPLEAREDLWILCQVAERLGLGPEFGYEDAAAVLREINRLLPSYGGVDLARVKRMGGLCLPCPEVEHPGTAILHVESFSTPDGRARIVPVHYSPPFEMPNDDFPLLLTTGRVALHHNAGSMTRRSPSLFERAPELFVEICGSDARDLGVGEGDMVVVATARGRVEAKARVTEKIKKGVVFMPFHYPYVNRLTVDALDPVAKIPEFKAAACKVSRG